MAIINHWSKVMTKPKPKNELKAYRGKQSYLTEEQIRMLKNNPNIVKVTDRQVHYTQTIQNHAKRESHGQTKLKS